MTKKKLDAVLKSHAKWLAREEGGQRADLRDAQLRWADLREADLDFSSCPLWCVSLDVKIDARIAAQLVYHAVRACQSVTDDDGVRAFCSSPEEEAK